MAVANCSSGWLTSDVFRCWSAHLDATSVSVNAMHHMLYILCIICYIFCWGNFLYTSRQQMCKLLHMHNLKPPLSFPFQCLHLHHYTYTVESEEAKALRSEATKIEGNLEAARNILSLGATIDGEFEEMSSVGLRNKIRVDPDEKVRKACYEGLTKIGDFVTENGFVELVKVRNKMAKALGYLDFYDYKVTNAEGFGKIALFEILDTLEEGTRPIMEAARKRFAEEKGASSLEPWNLSFFMAGDITRRMDLYFPFEKSVEQWGRSFAAMNIGYKGATMDLDLLDRKGKYSNGFCHWPQPAWVKPDGSWQPSTTHFTSLADPSAIGSGHTGLTTLMHEAGHAAHFANVAMPSPLFSQERSPTSVAYAENQSMFLDSLVGDADWMAKYAISREGDAIVSCYVSSLYIFCLKTVSLSYLCIYSYLCT